MKIAFLMAFLLLSSIAFAHETNETHEEPYQNVGLSELDAPKQAFWYSDIFLVVIGSIILACLLLLRLVKFEPKNKSR